MQLLLPIGCIRSLSKAMVGLLWSGTTASRRQSCLDWANPSTSHAPAVTASSHDACDLGCRAKHEVQVLDSESAALMIDDLPVTGFQNGYTALYACHLRVS